MNESCFAKITCARCQCEYKRNEDHAIEDCIVGLSRKIIQLQQDKVDRDALIQLLLRKVDRKSNDQFLHLLVNDFDAAKDQLNKQFNGIRISARTPNHPDKAVSEREDQDVSVGGDQ